MQTVVVAAAAAGAAVGAAGVVAWRRYQESKQVQDAPGAPGPVIKVSYNPAFKYGLPVRERVRQYSGYTVAFDPATRNPIWVLEHLTKQNAHGEGDRKKSLFFEDPQIEKRFRSKLSDYAGSGYDRGHQAPAMNHKLSQERMNDTFSLSNMSPQVGKGFNQDYWARFEKFTKDLVKRSDNVYVVTGPMFTPSLDPKSGLKMEYKLLGQFPQTVGVPTHFYKVILAETKDSRGQQVSAVGAFVMPNAPINPKTPLLAFAMPVEVVESVTGVRFFPAYLSDGRRQAVDVSAEGWRRLGKAQQAALAAQGVPALVDSYSIRDRDGAIVPVRNTPSFEELVNTSVHTGPPALRPPATGSSGEGAVHLCEQFACRLPIEEFWKSQSKPQKLTKSASM